ncbi:MAG: PilZ domain-containing protein [Candidatus Accumulibacter sp.]|jgi:hypothetical protein|nr:PilZ domain-containing protein [Accumulibacter sp.]
MTLPPNDPMNQERRKYFRITFHTPATLTFPDRTFEVEVLDLSLKGALVVLPAEITVTDQALCKLSVPLDETRTGITMKTRVVHLEDRRVGLRCLSIDLDSVTHLRRLVELNLGDPSLLDRELSEFLVE